MKTDIPTTDGNVISITSVIESLRMRRFTKRCCHRNVVADVTLVHLHCTDCDKDVNAVQWLLDNAEMFASWAREREQLIAERARFEGKTRCRCQHCNKLTRVRPLSKAALAALGEKT